jgi:hypothetical protein
MPNLRLCRETDTIEDPPAPLPFTSVPSWRGAGANQKEDAMDSIDFAQQALADAESKMEQLNELMEEESQSYIIAQWTDDDDDGPYAA